MIFVLPFLLGFIISFLGTIPPSMLNMSTAKITIQQSKKEGLKFALGVSMIVFVQAYVALYFAEYIHKNTFLDWYISLFSIVIFGTLSIYFYKQVKVEKQKKNKEKYKNNFVSGIIFSSLNMFAIPFYCGISSILNMSGLMNFKQQNILPFIIGSFFGTYFLLYLYATYALKITEKASILTKNLNYLLSFISGFISVITLIKILF